MADNKAGVSPPERRSLREIAKATSDPRVAAAEAKKEGHGTRAQIACKILCEELHTEGDRSMRKMTKNSGRANVVMLVIVTLVLGLGALAGCGGGNDEPRDWFSSKGDLSFLGFGYKNQHQKDLESWANAPKSVAPYQYFGNKNSPGYWNDGNLALASGSRHIFVNAEQPGLTGMPGKPAVKISGVQSGEPISVTATTGFANWADKILTDTDLADGVHTIQAVKLDANGAITAEADEIYTITFEGKSFFEGDTQILRGRPYGTGSIYLDSFNPATSILAIRTAGKKVQFTHNVDGGKPHVLDNEDVNGWSWVKILDQNDVAFTAGALKALLLELNADGSVKGLLDMSEAEFVADIPIKGSSLKHKGWAVYVDKGVVYPNPTALDTLTPPALKSDGLTTYPRKDTIPVGETFTFLDVMGVCENGYRTSFKNHSEIDGNSPVSNVASEQSALSYKGESPGVSGLTVQIGSIVSAPATELTVFESYLVLTASPSEIVSGGSVEITATLFKRGEGSKNISLLSTTTYTPDKPALLAMSGNVGTGGTSGNVIVTVEDTVTKTSNTITIAVRPKPKFYKVELPKKTFTGGEQFTPELIVISEGSFDSENKASEAKWSSSNTAVATTVVTTGVTTTKSGGGKTKLVALYLGLRIESEEFTVTAAAPAPTVSTISAVSSATVSIANTATAAVEVKFQANLSDSTSRAAVLTAVSVPSGAPYTAVISSTASDTALVSTLDNRSGTDIEFEVTGDDGKKAKKKVTITAQLASVDPISNLALQTSTTGQISAITGKMNDSANTSGATPASFTFDKLTMVSDKPTVADANATTGVVTAGTTEDVATITVTPKDDSATAFNESTVTPRTFTVTVTTPPPSVMGLEGDDLSNPNWMVRGTVDKAAGKTTIVVNPQHIPETRVNVSGVTPVPFLFASNPSTAISVYIRTGWTVVTENGRKGYSITIDTPTDRDVHLHYGETVGGVDKWAPNTGAFMKDANNNGVVESGEQNKLSARIRLNAAGTTADPRFSPGAF